MSTFTLPQKNAPDNEEITEIITGTGEILVDKKKNGEERPWKRHKLSSLKLYKLYGKAQKIDKDCISKSSYKALEHCASFLLYGINEMGEKRLKNADFCRARLCPMCNWRKSLKVFSQTSAITDLMLEKYPTTRFIFVTLTQKSCTGEDLPNQIKQMNEAFRKLTSPNHKFSFAMKFKASLLGYMRAIEVTYNAKTKMYHPHIHVIFAVKAGYFSHGYITQRGWRELWQKAMKLDYEPQINVQTIKAKKVDELKELSAGELPEDAGMQKKAMAAAVAETGKYPVKTDELISLSDDDAMEPIIVLSKTLRGKRLVVYGGLFLECQKALALDDVEDGDLVVVDEEEPINEVARIMYKFRVKVGCYVC